MSTQQSIEIKVTERQAGKGMSRGLRMSKIVPAVVYGPKTSNLLFSFSEVEADKYSKRKFENTIFTLKSDNAKLNNLKVLRKDFSVHPLTRRPIHFDFYAIDMTKEVTVKVELQFEGKPAGAASGGLLNITRRDVEVRCLPGNIPNIISIDISHLDVGQSVHVSDLKLPPDITMITDGSDTLATCAIVKEESLTTTAAAAEGTGTAAAPGAAATGSTGASGAATEKKS